jgi:hemerythrin superfamily protein
VDAIASLKADHQKLERLFRAFEHAGPRADTARADAALAVVETLAAHSAAEEEVFYPAVLEALPDARQYVLQSLEEHDVAAFLSIGISGLDVDNERFAAKASVLIADVRYHMREEEAMLFPEVRAAMSRRDLLELGARIDEVRREAPARPHLQVPGATPAGLLTGVVAGAVDRARDVGRKAVDEAKNLAS